MLTPAAVDRPERAPDRHLPDPARRRQPGRRHAHQRRGRHAVVQRRQQQSGPPDLHAHADQRHRRHARPRGRAHRHGGAVRLLLREDRRESDDAARTRPRRPRPATRCATRCACRRTDVPLDDLDVLRRSRRAQRRGGVRAGHARARAARCRRAPTRATRIATGGTNGTGVLDIAQSERAGRQPDRDPVRRHARVGRRRTAPIVTNQSDS